MASFRPFQRSVLYQRQSTPRSDVYRPESATAADDLALMRRIDELHLKLPFCKRRSSPMAVEMGERLAILCDKALQAFGAKLCKRLVRRSDA